MDQEPEHLGCAVIILKDNQILLGRRLNSYRFGYFGFPGGRLELTESLQNSAVRELHEETGIIAKEIKYLGAIREFQDGYNFIHFIFICNSWEGDPVVAEPDKCESWNYYPLASLPKPILPAHLASIKFISNPSLGYIDILS